MDNVNGLKYACCAQGSRNKMPVLQKIDNMLVAGTFLLLGTYGDLISFGDFDAIIIRCFLTFYQIG